MEVGITGLLKVLSAGKMMNLAVEAVTKVRIQNRQNASQMRHV